MPDFGIIVYAAAKGVDKIEMRVFLPNFTLFRLCLSLFTVTSSMLLFYFDLFSGVLNRFLGSLQDLHNTSSQKSI